MSKTYPLGLVWSSDYGERSRTIWIVFEQGDISGWMQGDYIEEEIVSSSQRRQIKLQVTKNAGNVREISIQKLDTTKDELIDGIRLGREESNRLIALLQALPFIPIEGGTAERIDDASLRAALRNPEAVKEIYSANPDRVRELVEADAAAIDIVAVKARRLAVERFEKLLSDEAFFAAESRAAGGPEKVWQQLLEANPWILGVGLSGLFLTAWDERKLEQSVSGRSVKGPGKIADALLATAGTVRSLVFAEVKPHNVNLVGDEYRSGVFGPSKHLTSGVTQAQQTVHLAGMEIRGELAKILPDGSESLDRAVFLRPRSYLIIGTLSEFQQEDSFHRRKFESFELYRRNLYEPEIITFDELLARARWQLSLLERQD